MNLVLPSRLDSIAAIRHFVDVQRRDGRSIGLVPTMGALHDGHLSLVRQARAKNDACVVTIFVNPTQFAAHEDLDAYPRPLQRDLDLLAAENVDAVFMPDHAVMYPDGFGTYVQPAPIGATLEGEHRPTHFRGVATVVLKLFQIVPADAAYFGQKDYQQLRVIETMVQDFNLTTRIVRCPIVREHDGLAMSSRNAYLTPDQRHAALALSRSLREAVSHWQGGIVNVSELETVLRDHLVDVDSVDYARVVDASTLETIQQVDRPAVALVAARVGATRLIDNWILDPSNPSTS